MGSKGDFPFPRTRGNAGLLTGEFQRPPKTPENLAINMGRRCLFSIICAVF